MTPEEARALLAATSYDERSADAMRRAAARLLRLDPETGYANGGLVPPLVGSPAAHLGPWRVAGTTDEGVSFAAPASGPHLDFVLDIDFTAFNEAVQGASRAWAGFDAAWDRRQQEDRPAGPGDVIDGEVVEPEPERPALPPSADFTCLVSSGDDPLPAKEHDDGN